MLPPLLLLATKDADVAVAVVDVAIVSVAHQWCTRRSLPQCAVRGHSTVHCTMQSKYARTRRLWNRMSSLYAKNPFYRLQHGYWMCVCVHDAASRHMICNAISKFSHTPYTHTHTLCDNLQPNLSCTRMQSIVLCASSVCVCKCASYTYTFAKIQADDGDLAPLQKNKTREKKRERERSEIRKVDFLPFVFWR